MEFSVKKHNFQIVKNPMAAPALQLKNNHPSSEAIYNFDIPEARDNAIIGSSNGWLVLINMDLNLTILNPITRARVDHYIPKLTYFKANTEINNPQELRFVVENLLKSYVYISPNYPESLSECVLAFTMQASKHVLFCKIGDSLWKSVRHTGGEISSLAYHRGKFYMVHSSGSVTVIGPKVGLTVVDRVVVPQNCLSNFAKWENELLLFVDCRDSHSDMKKFVVYKLKDNDGSYTWLECDELSEYTFFFTSKMVSAFLSYDPSYFQGKSICYLDGRKVLKFNLDKETEETMAVLRDGVRNPTCFYTYALDHARLYPCEFNPIWFAPSLL